MVTGHESAGYGFAPRFLLDLRLGRPWAVLNETLLNLLKVHCILTILIAYTLQAIIPDRSLLTSKKAQGLLTANQSAKHQSAHLVKRSVL